MKRTILLYYAPIIITAMIIGSLYPFATSGTILLSILFIPVAIMLWMVFFKVKKGKIAPADQPKALFATKKMLLLLLYSTLLSLIVFIGAFFNVKNFTEAVIDILFIPVIIQFLLWFLPKVNSPKK